MALSWWIRRNRTENPRAFRSVNSGRLNDALHPHGCYAVAACQIIDR